MGDQLPTQDSGPEACQKRAPSQIATADVQPQAPSIPSNLILRSQETSASDSSRCMSAPSIHSSDPDISDREEGHTMPNFTSFVDDNGRTYHGYMHDEYNYLLPNDGAEQDRLDFQHTLFSMILGGRLNLAPISDPRYVLDIGTGTGIWAIDFAKAHPNSHVVGTDISMIQPLSSSPNVEFYLENSETQDWYYLRPFDFIHMRAMITCFDDTTKVIQKAYDHLAPGGWLEMMDPVLECESPDDSVRGTATERWAQLMVSGAATIGRDLYKAREYKNYFAQAGFVDVVEKVIVYPGSPWPREAAAKKCGLFCFHDMLQSLDATRKLCGLAGAIPEELDPVIAKIRVEGKNPEIRFSWPMYVVYGRKPGNEDAEGAQ